MRSLIVGLVAAITLAGLPATASAQSSAQLPQCSGKRVMREAVYTRQMLKAAYIHVFYDSRTATACAFLNSTNATWGTRKHMTIMLKQCARPSGSYGRCDGQLQSTAKRGWYSGRTDTARLTVSRGCLMATGRVHWGKHYGLFSTKSNLCVRG